MKLPSPLRYFAELLRRPSRDHRFADLPAAYERSVIALRAYPEGPPTDIPDEIMLAWSAQHLRGGGTPPAFASLASPELYALELVYAVTTFGDPDYAAFARRFSDEARAQADDLRKFSRGAPLASASSAPLPTQRIHAVVGLRTAAPRAALRTPFKQVDELLDWLPGNSDPDLWHLLVSDLNYDYESTLRIVQWIVEQPQCDAATAALALIRTEAYNHLEFPTIDDCKGWDRLGWSIARSVCARAAAGGYTRRALNLACVREDDDQTDLLEFFDKVARDVTANGRTLPFAPPRGLLSRRFEGRAAVSAAYEVHDDWLCRRPGAAV